MAKKVFIFHDYGEELTDSIVREATKDKFVSQKRLLPLVSVDVVDIY